MQKGFIMIPRRFFESLAWKEKRVFSKADALLDIYSSADIMSKSMVFKFREIADRWGWPVGKVQRFLNMLSREGYITTEKAVIKVLDHTEINQTDTEAIQNRYKTDTKNPFVDKGLEGATDTKPIQNRYKTDTASRAYKNDNYNIMSIEEKEKDILTNVRIEKKETKSKQLSEEEVRFNEWMARNYPFVNKMPRRLTLQEFKKINALYTVKEISDKLGEMDNWTKLNTKRYAYLTLLKWLKKDYGERNITAT